MPEENAWCVGKCLVCRILKNLEEILFVLRQKKTLHTQIKSVSAFEPQRGVEFKSKPRTYEGVRPSRTFQHVGTLGVNWAQLTSKMCGMVRSSFLGRSGRETWTQIR